MITIELMGGLGNQLFQIFTTMAYGIQNNVPFCFPDVEIKHGWRKRVYWGTFLSNLQPYLKNTQCVHVIHEEGFHYTPIPSHISSDNIKLFGYFQSYKYFENAKEKIFETIELEKQKIRICEKLKFDLKNTISMHFRLGDYKKLQQHHPILPVGYYRSALDKICNATSRSDWNVMYVCEEEDKTAVQNTIDELQKSFPEMRFFKLEEVREDWEQMLAMSVCAHNIIANSSFSWFGAYFNTEPNKQVCYPSIWFGPAQGGKTLDDLCPPGWMMVS